MNINNLEQIGKYNHSKIKQIWKYNLAGMNFVILPKLFDYTANGYSKFKTSQNRSFTLFIYIAVNKAMVDSAGINTLFP